MNPLSTDLEPINLEDQSNYGLTKKYNINNTVSICLTNKLSKY